uniref:Ig-like domain-containing protein n=1 Tax=Pygocentrus nattereri TaxID=42514 RepID=A0AAR2K331_PYGNA
MNIPQLSQSFVAPVPTSLELGLYYNNNNNNNNFVCKMLCMFISAAENDESVLFRASEGDSLFLFCKDLISSSLKATWSWRPHSSGQNIPLQPDSAGERLHFRNKDNDFSLTISKVDWGDSGRYECQRFRSSSQYKTFFEVVVVRDFTLISICAVFFVLLVLIGAVCWRKKTKSKKN